MRSIVVLFILLLFLGCNESCLPKYKQSDLPVDVRVRDLLNRMTLDEKVAQVQNITFPDANNIGATLNGLSYGCTHDMQLNAYDCAEKYRKLRHYTSDSTRLGIPMLTACEGIQGLLQDSCTIFPHSLGLGSTFDPDLIRDITRAVGREGRAVGVNQILSPVLDIARDLRWGRVEETYGEDPFLIAEMGVAYVQGFSENNITCTPKHFMAHGSPTGGLNCANVSGGERELRSLYLYPFERVIREAAPKSVMTCYSSYDGVASVGSYYYMTDVLRGDLGFDGYLYSDWGSVEHLHRFHHVADTFSEAARMALEAGVDLNIDDTYKHIDSLVRCGALDESILDCAVGRILKVKFELGLFDEQEVNETPNEIIHNSEHIALARRAAQESIVLLENNNNILPLNINKYRNIAVIGPNANQTVYGDYSWTYGDTDYGSTVVEGLKSALGGKANIRVAEGCDWWSQHESGFAEACNVARQSDIVIAAVGTRSTYLARKPENVTAGEGFDLSSLELPGVQLDLLKELKKCGKPLVVVFISGKPLAMPWVKDNADAVVVQWYGGEEQGNAVADVLLGKVNPSGRLNVSFPRSTGNTPCYYNYLPTDRGHFGKGGNITAPEGHYVFEEPCALWSFGHGLSYTHFEYTDMKLNKFEFSTSDTIRVNVLVANKGQMNGKEVVQLYVRDKYSSVATPVKQLKAFRKITVPVGEPISVELKVPISELSIYDQNMKRVVEAGEFELMVGKSSDDIVMQETISVVK